MKIAVVGTGGVGGCYGAALAKAGADVTFVARGAHLAAMRENGVRVEGGRGETVIRPVQATGDIASIEPVDIVLFCVKLGSFTQRYVKRRWCMNAQPSVLPIAARLI